MDLDFDAPRTKTASFQGFWVSAAAWEGDESFESAESHTLGNQKLGVSTSSHGHGEVCGKRLLGAVSGEWRHLRLFFCWRGASPQVRKGRNKERSQGTSTLCFTVVPPGEQAKLLAQQFYEGVGIFACDHHMIFSSSPAEAGGSERWPWKLLDGPEVVHV